MECKVTEYKTGATRSPRSHKYDMVGFTSPLVESIFGRYMQKHRYQSDGKIRAADNWKKGMCIVEALESGDRHWKSAKALMDELKVIDPDTGEEPTLEDCLCGVMFACQVILRERALSRDEAVCFGEVQEAEDQQSRRKSIYLAGKMRGVYRHNFPAFETWASDLRSYGWNVVSPAEMDLADGIDPYALPEDHDWSKEPPGVDFKAVMERDLEALRKCDAIALIPGWMYSEGVTREDKEAYRYNLPRVHLEDGFPPATPEEIFGEEL